MSNIIAESMELSALLQGSSGIKLSNQVRRSSDSYYDDDDDDDNKKWGTFTQWTSTDGKKFFPAGATSSELTPGYWEPKYSPDRGYFMEKLECKTDGLLKFPETNSERVVAEIQNFWGKEDLFKAHNLAYKRGIILWGPPGSGKSCTIKLVLNDVIERGGIAIKFNIPQIFIECVRIFRSIQPTTPIVVLMEDIDSIISEFGETDVLNILDGVENVEKVVYVATTNYPEQLGERIINRPSRFDRRFKMPHPSKASRRIYLEHLIKIEAVKTQSIVDLDKWVDETHGMSIAHLKELFIAVCILGDPYEEVINVLRSMVEDKISSEDKPSNMGFVKYSGEED